MTPENAYNALAKALANKAASIAQKAADAQEAAFAAFPPANVTPRLTTSEAYHHFLWRERADRLGTIQRVVATEHLVVGQAPHAGHAVHFAMANGTQMYFAPHSA